LLPLRSQSSSEIIRHIESFGKPEHPGPSVLGIPKIQIFFPTMIVNLEKAVQKEVVDFVQCAFSWLATRCDQVTCFEIEPTNARKLWSKTKNKESQHKTRQKGQIPTLYVKA
jgi:hypothetical protein